MIAVVGGQGRLGRAICERFDDETIRVVTRSSGDISGAKVVISSITGFAHGRHGPRDVDRDANLKLIDESVRSGVERFVLVSVNGASPDHRMELARMKYDAEQHLIRSGLLWTIVRPTVFMEAWAEILGRTLHKHKAMLLGRGENPIDFVSTTDVADVIVRTVGGEFERQVVGVGGPEELALRGFVRRLDPEASIRTMPLPMVRALGAILRGPLPFPARIMRTAAMMDTTDMSLDRDGVDVVVTGAGSLSRSRHAPAPSRGT